MYKSLRSVVISFTVSILLLGLLSFSAYQEVKASLEYAQSVEQIHEVLHTSDRLWATVKDLEASQRGYLLTKSKTYLAHFLSGKEQLNRSFASLPNMVINNPIQFKRLDTLKRSIRRKMNLMYINIHKIEKGEVVDSLIFEKGYQQSNYIYSVLGRFQAYQRQVLSVKAIKKSQTDSQMSNKMTMLASFSAILLILSFGLVFTELKKRISFQTELENTIEELKRSNSELEQFAYVASHDMQEPLRKIRAFSDMLLLRQRDTLNEDGKQTLQKIAKSSERLQNLINDLLAFSRLVNTNTQQQEQVSLNDVLADVLKDLSIVTLEKSAIIEFDRLPTITGVKFQLHQLFLNLIANALKFNKSGMPPSISIRYNILLGSQIRNIPNIKSFAQYHEIAIADNGIGFEQEYADKIFMIFQRLHTRTQFDGTGIGLAVCKRVITNHHGYIKAEGVPNHGATFTIYLPTNRNEE